MILLLVESDNEEVCALTYIEMNKNRYVIAVGWDKAINIYSDANDGGVHHMQKPLPRWPHDRVCMVRVHSHTTCRNHYRGGQTIEYVWFGYTHTSHAETATQVAGW